MAIDYTPDLKPFTFMNDFKFWCEEVLPTVYDDSLSYYEVLCKIRDYINSLIETDNNMNTNITALKDAFDKMQAYLNELIITKGAVVSVNGKSGAVELTASDIGALADTTVIPTELPTPEKLIFTGAIDAEFNGDEEVTVTIPDAIETYVISVNGESGVVTVDVPTKLPTPNKLTFTGAVSAEFDGSEAVTVNIPEGGGTGTGTVKSVNSILPDTAGNVRLIPSDIGAVAEGSIPTTLPSPYGVTFTGGATGFYDGSSPVTIKIPSGGGGSGSDVLYVTRYTDNTVPTVAGGADYGNAIEIPDYDSTYYGVVGWQTNANVAGATFHMTKCYIQNGYVYYNLHNDSTVSSSCYVSIYVLHGNVGGGSSGGVTSVNGETGAVVIEIPSTLPNPYKLTFTGSANVEYDGSQAITVNIPEGGSGSGTNIKAIDITTTTTWDGTTSPYSQAISVSGYTVTNNTMVDLHPDNDVIQQMVADEIYGLYVENNSGYLNIYAVGNKPSVELMIPATIYEVTV